MTRKNTTETTQKTTQNGTKKMSVKDILTRCQAEHMVAKWLPTATTPKVGESVKMTKSAYKKYHENVEKRHGTLKALPSRKYNIDGVGLEIYSRIAPDGFTWIECHVIDGQKHDIIATKPDAHSVVFYRGH